MGGPTVRAYPREVVIVAVVRTADAISPRPE
jgi:hypothetical protein